VADGSSPHRLPSFDRSATTHIVANPGFSRRRGSSRMKLFKLCGVTSAWLVALSGCGAGTSAGDRVGMGGATPTDPSGGASTVFGGAMTGGSSTNPTGGSGTRCYSRFCRSASQGRQDESPERPGVRCSIGAPRARARPALARAVPQAPRAAPGRRPYAPRPQRRTCLIRAHARPRRAARFRRLRPRAVG
jgi:hypothetical protein